MKDPDPTIAHSILRGQICASRPNGLFGGFWSAENHFIRSETGGFARLEQTKRVVQRLLVCRKLLYAQQNRRICKARADQTGCSAAFGLLKITLYVAKQEDLLDSSRPKGLFSCIWSAFKRKCSLIKALRAKKTSRAFPNRQKTTKTPVAHGLADRRAFKQKSAPPCYRRSAISRVVLTAAN